MSATTATPTGPPVAASLTARQLEVALLLRNGLRHGEIAARLGISQRQVARLAAHARERANARTAGHLVVLLAGDARAAILAAAA